MCHKHLGVFHIKGQFYQSQSSEGYFPMGLSLLKFWIENLQNDLGHSEETLGKTSSNQSDIWSTPITAVREQCFTRKGIFHVT
jgi:hypothetical protein